MRRSATETSLRCDGVVAEDPVEHVEVTHLVVVGATNDRGSVTVVYLNKIQKSQSVVTYKKT